MSTRGAAILVVVLGLACVDTGPETWCEDHLEICGTQLYSIIPSQGPSTGGTQVTLVGRALEEGGEIFFGETPLGSVTYDSSRQQATGITPVGVSGAVVVRIVNRNGAFSFPGLYAFMPPTSISSVSPTLGERTGGTRIQVRGTNIHPGSKLYLGTVEATNLQINSTGTLISGDTPPAAQLGTADVRVSGPGGNAVLEDAFRFVAWLRLPMEGANDTGGFVQLKRSGTSSTFYASTRSDLFRSDSSGDSWVQVNRPSLGDGSPPVVGVDPFTPERLYYAEQAVHWSSNGGQTWTPSLFPLDSPGQYFNSLEVRSDGVVFALSYDSLYRSTDSGVTFSKVSTLSNSSLQGMCLHPENPSLVVVFGYDGWRAVSADGGLSFSVSQEPGNQYAFCKGGLEASEVWLADYTPSLRVSTDQAATFGSPAEAPPLSYFYDMVVDSSGAGRYFLSDGWGLYELNRADASPAWNQIATTEGGSIALDTTGRLLSAGDRGISRRAASTGTAWTTQHTGLQNPIVSSLAQESSGGLTTLYMGTRNGKVFQTANPGGGWGELGTLPGEIGSLAVTQVGSVRTLYAASGGGVYRFPFPGGGWTQPLDNLGSQVNAERLISDPSAPGELFTFGWDAFQRLQADGTFILDVAGLPDASTHDYYPAVTRPTGGGALTLYTVVGAAGVPLQAFAHPQGGTWAPVGTPLPNSVDGDLRTLGATAEGLLVWLNARLYLMPFADGQWLEITGNNLPWYPQRFIVDPSDRSKVVAASGNTLYRSDNSGRTWRQANIETYGGSPGDGLIDFNSPASVYLAAGSAGVLVSRSGGE